MSPERWQRVQALFKETIELDAPLRAPFLDEACAGDSDLRREVESLLTADAETHSLIGGPIVDLHDAERTWIGRRVGPYEVREEIGRGGLGVVYLAARADGDFEQRVALKVIKRGMETDEVIRRFRAERAILARLEHPKIARLLDGGTTEDGRPYFVMEIVRGERLTSYCENRGLTVHERLDLFCQICEAVAFAHQNLVVHRDLKPSNVLVGEEGPKLLDFGIAKLLKDDAEPATVLTRLGSNPMTLDYASPEQARGGVVTTATDVYSLGVILYELLTGERPCRLDGCDSTESLRRICEEEPAAPHKLRRDLDGDLDSIVLKALRKEPEERYGSVERLADDVRRYLAGRPVHAHQGSWKYRTGKLLRRHKLGVGVAAILLAAALAVTGLWWQAGVERDHAEAERRRAERVTELLVEIFEAPDPDKAKGEELTAHGLIERGKEKALAGLDEEPEVRALLLQTLGRVYRKLGDYDETRGLLEEALRIRRETLDPDDPRIAESLYDLANVLRREGDPDAVRPLVEEAVAIQRRNAGELPLELARGLTILASLRYSEGGYEEAEALLLEALEIGRRAPGATEDDLLVTLSNLAATRTRLGRRRETVEVYREVLEIRRRLHGPLHTTVAQGLHNLGTVLRDLGELREAEELLREALRIRRKLHGEEHPDVAKSRRRLGTVFAAKGDFAAAAAEYRQALDVQLRMLGEDHPEVAITRTKLAAAQAGLGEARDCETLARQALAVLRAQRPDDWRVADAESVLGGCLADRGHRDEAEPLLRDSYERLRQMRGEDDPATRAAGKRLAASPESSTGL